MNSYSEPHGHKENHENVDITVLPGYASFRKELRVINGDHSLPTLEEAQACYESFPQELKDLAKKDAKEGYSINRPANKFEIQFIKSLKDDEEEISITPQFRLYLQQLAQITKLYQKEFGITFFQSESLISTSITVGNKTSVMMPTSESHHELGTIHTHPTKTDFVDEFSLIPSNGGYHGDIRSMYLDNLDFDAVLTDTGSMIVFKRPKNFSYFNWVFKSLLIIEYLKSPQKFKGDLEESIVHDVNVLKKPLKRMIKKSGDTEKWLEQIYKLKDKYSGFARLPEFFDGTVYIDDVIATLLKKSPYRFNVYMPHGIMYKVHPVLLKQDVSI